MEHKTVLGIKISNCNYLEFLEDIKHAIEYKNPIHIVTANAAMIVESLADKELKRCLEVAEIITADGMSVVWASRFLGHALKERITGIDSICRIMRQAEELQHKIFLLGAKQEILEKAIKILREKYPKLNIVGYHNGYFNNESEILELIKKTQPDILIVGMGFVLQEKLINRFRKVINIPVMMGVGGSFDVIAGEIKRAPLFLQKIGMEWFFRVIQEPKRLWKRYLVTNSIFIFKVVGEKIFNRQ